MKVLVLEQPSTPQEIANPSVGIFSGTAHCENGHNLWNNLCTSCLQFYNSLKIIYEPLSQVIWRTETEYLQIFQFFVDAF